MASDFWEDVAYVQRAKNRERVLHLLISAGRPMTPTELADEMGIVVKSASRAVRQLNRRDLVECTNPEAPRDRRYRPTEHGRGVHAELERIEEGGDDAEAAELAEPPVTYAVERSDAFQEAVSYLQRSGNRKAVMRQLAASDIPLTPTELGDRIGTGFNGASRAVRQLADHGLARCVNPASTKYRRYELTDRGKEVYQALTQ